LAVWDATKGSDDGLTLFDEWSQKSEKYNAAYTQKRWQEITGSPPSKITERTIFWMADQVSTIWRDVTIEQRVAIEDLAALSRIQYDTRRQETAKNLCIRVNTLDDYVQMVRPPQEVEAKGQGTTMNFAATDPWPEAVAGEALVNDMVTAIKRHVILTDEQAIATSLWTIHTHAFEYAEHSARLHISSPAPRCGKTTLMNTISELVTKPIRTENLSLSVMFRVIEMYQPTLLVDEADAFLRDNEDMRGIINSGHQHGGTYLRTVGEDFEPKAFSVWAPVAIAGIGRLASTIEDRSITVSLRRRLKNEELDRLTRKRDHLKVLARRVARWVADNGSKLIDADPALPEKLGDREQDNWRPLIAIADAISADLGERARKAATKISDEEADDDEGYAIQCLADVAAIFEVKNKDRLKSQDIVDALILLEDRPWAEWKHGKPMTKNSLARLLKPFGIHPIQIRFEKPPAATHKGYWAAPVQDAKERYVDQDRKLDERDVVEIWRPPSKD
jgi:putative DNA primase/helicase